MRLALLAVLPALLWTANLSTAQAGSDSKTKDDKIRKLTDEEKLTLMRGLSSEYAKVKVFLPRSKKALKMKTDGSYDKAEWKETGMEFGPVARVDDLIQVTHVEIEENRIIFEIDGGFKPKGKWYNHIEVGGGAGGSGTRPVNQDPKKAFGTSIALIWDGRVPPEIQVSDVKKMLKPVLDFEMRSASEDYFSNLPPEIQEAIKAKRAAIGMTRDQVRMAIGIPRDKLRETKDGLDTEDWIYGLPPGKITFVTFANGKVIQVKDSFAGLGGATAPPLKPVQ